MKRHNSKDAYYQRLRQLSEIDKSKSNNNKNNSVGTLVDFKESVDGIKYGIIKENHNYYIKKCATLNENVNVSDFVYIGGLENITKHQYKTLGEAEKQRHFLLQTISESYTFKQNPNGGKRKMLLENEETVTTDDSIDTVDAATDIKQAEDKLDDLETATDNAEKTKLDQPDTNVDDSPELDIDSIDVPEEGGEETPEVSDGEEGDEETKEIEKLIGKVTNLIRNSELTDSQTKSYVNSFLTSFKDNIAKVEIEDRKAMANKIMKVVSDEETADLDVSDEVSEGEETCSECGSFTQYVESRGYTKESIMECDDAEMSSLISGYANAHNDGENDGDFESVSLFTNDNIMETLANEYGHDEYTEKLKPYVDNLNESNDEDKLTKINELNWGNAFKAAKNVVGGKVKNAGQAVSGAVKGAGQAVAGAVTKKLDSIKNSFVAIGDEISKNYNAREQNSAIDKIEELASTLGELISKYNQAAVKAGGQQVDPVKIAQTIRNQIKSGVNLSKYRNTSVSETETDPANVETQPNIGFAPDSQSMGVMSESEIKIRKYVRNRLKEMTGMKKPSLNESKKSDKLKKLDKLIESQFNLYNSEFKNTDEGVMTNVGHALGFKSATKNKLKDGLNSGKSASELFSMAFPEHQQPGPLKKDMHNLNDDQKIKLVNQVINDPDGIGRLGYTRDGQVAYRPAKSINLSYSQHTFGSGQ